MTLAELKALAVTMLARAQDICIQQVTTDEMLVELEMLILNKTSESRAKFPD